MKRQDNPEVARSLRVTRGGQISWLNKPSSAEQAAGRSLLEWWMRGCGGKPLCPLAGGVVTEWVKWLHQFGAIIMSKGEDGAWRNKLEEEEMGGAEPICILQVYSSSPTPLEPLLPWPGPFTVRLFNFPEIGLWQLCHADERSGSQSHLIYFCSATAEPPPLPTSSFFFLLLAIRDVKAFS